MNKKSSVLNYRIWGDVLLLIYSAQWRFSFLLVIVAVFCLYCFIVLFSPSCVITLAK